MPDLTTAATQPALAATAAASVTASVPNAVQVEVADVSQALQNLTRVIQTGATVTAPPTGNILTLATALGNVTISLPQLGAAEQQTLLQQLSNLAVTQRPLTLALQPGSPPSQAVLLIPPSAGAMPLPNIPNTALPIPLTPLPPLTVGETLPAIILPANISLPSQTAPVAEPLPSQPVVLSPLPSNVQVTAASAGPAIAPPTPVAGQPLIAALPPTAAASETEPPATQPLQNSALPPAQNAAISTPAVATAIPAAVSSQTPVATAQTPIGMPLAPLPAVEGQPAAVTAATTQIPAAGIQTNTDMPPATAPLAPISIAPPALENQAPAPAATQPPLTTYAPPQPAPQTTNLQALLQPGNEVSLHIDAILPPQASLPPLAANQIAATIVGSGTDGQLILKAGDATLFVKAQATAPPGSSVILTVEAARASQLLPLPVSDPVNFQALPQAMAALAQIDPAAMQQMMMRLPQPTEALPAALLLLFGAFKQGDARGWLGEEATESLLRAGKLDLITGLSRELGSAGQIMQDATVGQWNAYPVPLYSQAQFQALTLYVHADKDNRKDGEKNGRSADGKIRFLIDMRLSRLGAMQIDGFVQPKKIDMILRSEHVLPEGMHNDLRGAYIKAVGAVGFAGSLNFQVGRQHWLNMQRHAVPGIVT